MEKHTLIDNPENRCFEFHIDGLKPRIDYVKTAAGDLFLTHTEVPNALQGRGIGTELVEAILREAKRRNCKVIPLCSFVSAYIGKNPEWEHIVKEGADERA